MQDAHGCQETKITYKGSIYMQTKPINPTTLSNETIATNYREPTRTGLLLALWEQAATKCPLTAQGGINNMEKQRSVSETKTAIYSTTKTVGKTN